MGVKSPLEVLAPVGALALAFALVMEWLLGAGAATDGGRSFAGDIVIRRYSSADAAALGVEGGAVAPLRGGCMVEWCCGVGGGALFPTRSGL